MEYIRVTKENIENEHICCAISSNKDIQVISQEYRAWKMLYRVYSGRKCMESNQCRWLYVY